MSFSATILFSPPNANEAKCCCCTCKREPGAEGPAPLPPPSCTPITVSGHGLAVENSEQLLHVIYQRVDKVFGLAEAALGLARANNEALRRLEEEVGALRRGAAATPLKASPPQVPELEPQQEEEEEEEEEAEGLGNGVQVVIEELKQLGAAAGPPDRLGFSPMQPADSGGLGGDLLGRDAFWESRQATLTVADMSLEDASRGEARFSLGFASTPCRKRSNGQKNARRKRDLVLSKLVHNKSWLPAPLEPRSPGSQPPCSNPLDPTPLPENPGVLASSPPALTH
uniref:Uncharacterized protein n=1 Tax=Sphenodon punctatus TaxID=8508 RepID=A0A8D0G3N4_SPHPU